MSEKENIPTLNDGVEKEQAPSGFFGQYDGGDHFILFFWSLRRPDKGGHVIVQAKRGRKN